VQGWIPYHDNLLQRLLVAYIRVVVHRSLLRLAYSYAQESLVRHEYSAVSTVSTVQ
jgi:hypothetical protein